MLESLAKIKNPLVRGVTAACTIACSIVMISGAIAGFVDPKAKSDRTHKVITYTTLISGVGGALLGSIVQKKEKRSPQLPATTETKENVWKDWRNFVVDRKVKESQEITSFYLKPEDGGDLPDFKPGQFLTIQLNIPEQTRPIIRTYSLSDYPENRTYYRLSIKRETAPKGLNVPPGISSSFMHDRIQQGSVILAKPPNGKFFLDLQKSSPAILVSNGVGLTPMLSMAKACSRLNRDRQVWYIHGARNGVHHACREEILAIAAENPNLHVHFCYSRPQPEDEGKYNSQGYADINLIQEIVAPELDEKSLAEAEYFLCGSPSFLKSLREGLAAWGVESDRVFYEEFSKSKKTLPTVPLPTEASGKTTEIVFARSGKTFVWQPADGTILDFAEAKGMNPPFSCRQGICLTCMCEIEAGEIEYAEPPTGTPDEGSVLICVGKPKTAKIVLNL